MKGKVKGGKGPSNRVMQAAGTSKTKDKGTLAPRKAGATKGPSKFVAKQINR